jgi:hypothetical protein
MLFGGLALFVVWLVLQLLMLVGAICAMVAAAKAAHAVRLLRAAPRETAHDAGSKRCPKCKLWNPVTALRCDCSYDFKLLRRVK